MFARWLLVKKVDIKLNNAATAVKYAIFFLAAQYYSKPTMAFSCFHLSMLLLQFRTSLPSDSTVNMNSKGQVLPYANELIVKSGTV